MTQIYNISSIYASPPLTKVQSLALVYKNNWLPQYPAFVLLRFVHLTYPNDRTLNYVEVVRTGTRIMRDEFDRLVSLGALTPTEQTAAILGRVKPSRRSEIMNSRPHYSVAA